MKEKNCLECNEKITGRIDKKFCGDHCRNSYNNRINRTSKNLIRNINNRLRKNYKILSDLSASGETKISRSILFDKGFNFKLFTSTEVGKNGNNVFYIYDQGYAKLAPDTFLLVYNQNIK